MRRLFFALLTTLGVTFAKQASAQTYYPHNDEWFRKDSLDNSYDRQYWDSWDIRSGEFRDLGGNLTARFNKVYLDSMIDPIPPKDEPGRELIRYFVVFDITSGQKKEKRELTLQVVFH